MMVVVRVVLLPWALLFALIVALRRMLHRHGLLSSKAVATPTISVGALHVGGLGKTPIAHQVIEILRQREIETAFLSRGYGRETRGPRFREGGSPVVPSILGDEPAMLGERIADLPIAVAADRYVGARLLEQQSSPRCIVLDDAFSHLKFQTSAEFIVIPADPLQWHETLPLPAGSMREGWNARSNAHQHHYWFHSRGGLGEIESFHPRVRALWENLSLNDRVLTGTVVEVAEEWGEGSRPGCRLVLGAGIARPNAFEASVQVLGYEVVATHWHRDHAEWTDAMFEALLCEAKRLGAAVGVTEKDAVKLRHLDKDLSQVPVLVFRPIIRWQMGEERVVAFLEDALAQASKTL